MSVRVFSSSRGGINPSHNATLKCRDSSRTGLHADTFVFSPRISGRQRLRPSANASRGFKGFIGKINLPFTSFL